MEKKNIIAKDKKVNIYKILTILLSIALLVVVGVMAHSWIVARQAQAEYDRLAEEGLASRLILQVHDELLVETAEAEQEQVTAILSEEMQHAADLSVALEIDMHSGRNWYEAK